MHGSRRPFSFPVVGGEPTHVIMTQLSGEVN
ncbi:hypothetical protein E2C01_060999 [Portunus trituberculatus]|uniref:Uncharacterized protein n=1 Tax=Portunus trituberculatus TaxID=210409 RepID=A0A5B7H9K8_PORTR|nr:hypothetical protein [Portunus trituberculatus]